MEGVNRKALDFDFEPTCSVTLASTNIYVCLACGKFFQGRTESTPAYLHSLNEGHPLYMSLSTERVFSLPDGSEIFDHSLDDIRQALHPRFSPEYLASLDSELSRGTDLYGKEFVAGFYGLTSSNQSSYITAVAMVLAHYKPLRDFILRFDQESIAQGPSTLLLRAFAQFIRKLWNPAPFKACLSPHELFQAIRTASQNRFQPSIMADASDFLAWTLNTLERSFALAKLPPILQEFRGQLKATTSKVILDDKMRDFYDDIEGRSESKIVPFFFLSLDLPPVPLFQDPTGKTIIPQVSLPDLLKKYDGIHVTSRGETEQTFQLLRLPRYLILQIKRLVKGEFGAVEKNKTIVSFSVKDLALGNARYNLVANISHFGEVKDGRYVTHVRHPGTDTWFEADGLNIKEISPQILFLTDTYIQVWELQN